MWWYETGLELRWDSFSRTISNYRRWCSSVSSRTSEQSQLLFLFESFAVWDFPRGLKAIGGELSAKTRLLQFQTNQINISLIMCSTNRAFSDIPIAKPVAGVRVGLVDGQFIVNPTVQEMSYSVLDMIIAGTSEAVLMIEVWCLQLISSLRSKLKWIEMAFVSSGQVILNGVSKRQNNLSTA